MKSYQTNHFSGSKKKNAENLVSNASPVIRSLSKFSPLRCTSDLLLTLMVLVTFTIKTCKNTFSSLRGQKPFTLLSVDFIGTFNCQLKIGERSTRFLLYTSHDISETAFPTFVTTFDLCIEYFMF